MRKNKGSGLVDYILPTALVGLVVGLGVYNLAEGGGLEKFITASGNMKNGSSDGEMVVTAFGNKATSGFDSAAEASSSPDIPDVPIPDNPSIVLNDVECISGNCDLDFGSFALTGIPENFADVVETAGTSGGTETLLSIIDQVVQAAEDNPSIDSSLIKQLANKGHLMADGQKEIEEMINGMNSYYGDISYLQAELDNAKLVIENSDDDSSFSSLLSEINSELSDSSDPNEQAMLQIVNALGTEIMQMNYEFKWGTYGNVMDLKGGVDNYINTSTTSSYSGYDPSTEVSDMVNAVNNPDTSGRTDVNSSIICATGNGEDTGTSCN